MEEVAGVFGVGIGRVSIVMGVFAVEFCCWTIPCPDVETEFEVSVLGNIAADAAIEALGNECGNKRNVHAHSVYMSSQKRLLQELFLLCAIRNGFKY